jgi:uncharacterized repeat protein (TIGR03803 family)
MKRILLFSISFILYFPALRSQILLGTTFNGGTDGLGTISKFDVASNKLTVLKSLGTSGLAPASSLIQASDGKLYGMALSGGVNNFGSIYSYDPGSGVYTLLKSLADIDGRYPTGALLQASDGKLYGMTNGGSSDNNGILFSYDPQTSTCVKLYDFLSYATSNDGTFPYGSLVQGSDGKLYGVTCAGGENNGGAIFSFDISTAIYKKLADFPFEAGLPKGDLVETPDGKFYVWTSGIIYHNSSIFSFDPVTQTLQSLYNSHTQNDSYGSLMLASDGNLYGMQINGGSSDCGYIFSFDPALSKFNKVVDFDPASGQFPVGTLQQGQDGKLYGVAKLGGTGGNGAIFSFDPSSATLTMRAGFSDNLLSFPVGSLVQGQDGRFYGVTGGEGRNNQGSIFSFDPSTHTLATLSTFTPAQSGSNISGKLMLANDGKLYGMSDNGGNSQGGVIFSLDPTSNTYSELENLDLIHGSHPLGGLIQGKDKKLYGLTSRGGVYDALAGNDQGVLFSFDSRNSMYTRLFTFNFYGPLTGSSPYGTLLQTSDGKFYGMNSFGGVGMHGVGGGMIFSYDPSSLTFTRLFDFADDLAFEENGSYPYGSFIQANDRKLYGMTSVGGTDNDGVIFNYDPVSGSYAKLLDFNGSNGSNPYGSLVQAKDGKIYGMTWGGGNSDAGVIFSYDPASSIYTKLYDFDFINGSHPYGDLMQASDGKLYGMTNSGGSNDLGTIFSFDPVSATFTKLLDYDGTNGANPYFGSAFIEMSELAPLPIMLLNFSGENNGKINRLSWTIENEQNLNYFVLQRSVDGQYFSDVSQLKNTGNSAYKYDDVVSDTINVYYYRLKIVDIDGHFKYSDVIKLTLPVTGFLALVNPNPFKDLLVITVQSPVYDNALIAITDLSGRRLFTRNEPLSRGTNVVRLTNDGRLPNGTYVLTIVTSGKTKTFKLVKAQ